MSDIPRRYAQALYGTGQDERELIAAAQAIMASPALWEALRSPIVNPEEKQAVLSGAAVCPDASNLLRFFHLLTEKGRIALLPIILTEFHGLALAAENKAECVMTCVRIPSPQQQARLRDILCELHGKSDVILLFRLEPALLGGFILEIEGVTYDQSVRGRLLDLSRSLEEVNAT